MLITFGGLPGTGKTTIARLLAQQLQAVYLRIDTVEQALVGSGMSMEEIGPSGYMVAYAVAADNLRLGLCVITDSVNALNITRQAWQHVAHEAGVPCIDIELICSDQKAHQARVETRSTDIPGLILPTWQKVREREYHPWHPPHLMIDTAQVSADQAVDLILHHIHSGKFYEEEKITVDKHWGQL